MKKRGWLYLLIIALGLFIFSTGCQKDTSNIFPNTITDYDGNVYHTVQIGKQTWMKENLAVTHNRNGKVVTAYAYSDSTDSTFYNPVNYFGLLYDFTAASDTAIAPVGFHVASAADWDSLIIFLGGDSIAGGKLKIADTTFWFAPNLVSATDSTSGFNAFSGGYNAIDTANNFQLHNIAGFWWTSTSANATDGFCRYIYGSSTAIYKDSFNYNYGLSIRCVKNK